LSRILLIGNIIMLVLVLVTCFTIQLKNALRRYVKQLKNAAITTIFCQVKIKTEKFYLYFSFLIVNLHLMYKGLIPEGSPTNCLRTTFRYGTKIYHAISSEFASSLLSKGCKDEFIKSAMEIAFQSGNRSFYGWVFEMDFRNRLKVRDEKGTKVQLISRKLGQQGSFENGDSIEWLSREVVRFGDINKDKVEVN